MADYTIDSKYIAVCDVAQEDVWINKFITGLDVVPSIANPVDLYCDNNGAIVLV